ncbi:MAG: HU family DNA-binding protein [Gluconacetobacter diazotrophicus]|nr:HU family DNA-binding protein [Gluconacetobacter diazotrophicus]
MNHADLVAKVASHADITREKASDALEAVAKSITESLNAGEEVRFSGLGIFDVSSRAARQGRNPQTGESIQIAASKAARFRAAKGLKDGLNAGAAKAAPAAKKAAPAAKAAAAPKAAAKAAPKKK